jgi:hypothetical protein
VFIDQLDWRDLNDVLNEATPEERDYWEPKYPGHRASPFYLEGFDIFDESGAQAGLHVKGIEVRTVIAASVEKCLANLYYLFDAAKQALAPLGLKPAVVGGHPTAPSFRSTRAGRSLADWKAAEVTMSTAGIHVNISFSPRLMSAFDFEQGTNRLDLQSPMLAVCSLNSPFLRGKPWQIPGGGIGKSSRSFLRSFYRVPLRAKPGHYGTRFHVSLYDSVPSLERIGALMELSTGALLSPVIVDEISPTVRSHNLIEMARYGFAAHVFDGNDDLGSIRSLIPAALEHAAMTLHKYGVTPRYMQSLDEVVSTEFLFADDILEVYYEQNQNFGAAIASYHDYIDRDRLMVKSCRD